MSVYVDPTMPCIPSGRWRWRESCHMFADTLDELHAFAARVGLRREWFQVSFGRSLPHYDLHPARRATALKLGAIELDRRAAVAKWDDLGYVRRPLRGKAVR